MSDMHSAAVLVDSLPNYIANKDQRREAIRLVIGYLDLHRSTQKSDSDIIDEQEHECERLRQQVVDEQSAKVKLVARVYALEQDKARLDWFSDQHQVLKLGCRHVIWCDKDQGVRTAIDAAMSADQ